MRTILKVVINGLPSVHSKRSYHRGIRDFLEYWVEKGKPVPDKLFLQTYVHHLQDTGVGAVSINVRITAIRKFAAEATDYNVWPPHVQTSVEKVKRIPVRGNHAGTWLTLEQSQKLINAPDLEKNSLPYI
jgi:site-specific recombinase XerD